jgi:hypothetical protein
MKQAELEAFCKSVGIQSDRIRAGEPSFSIRVWAVPEYEPEAPKEIKLSPAVYLWPHSPDDYLPALVVDLHGVSLKEFEVLFVKALLLDNVPASDMQVYWWRRPWLPEKEWGTHFERLRRNYWKWK